jgi:hypothetical protein
MPRRPTRPLLRDLLAVALLAVLAGGGYACHRSAEAARRWQPVAREAEGLTFRIPPDWQATPAGYADPAYRSRPGQGMLLVVRSWAIPREIAAGARSPEAAALDAWVEGQRAHALRGQRILEERRIRVDGARGVLQVVEDPRDPLPYLVLAATASGGRLYTFSAQFGRAVDRREGVRVVRRVLGTVEWVQRPATGARAPAAGAARPAALQR